MTHHTHTTVPVLDTNTSPPPPRAIRNRKINIKKNMEDGLPCHGKHWRQWQCDRHGDTFALPCHGDYWRQWQCGRHIRIDVSRWLLTSVTMWPTRRHISIAVSRWLLTSVTMWPTRRHIRIAVSHCRVALPCHGDYWRQWQCDRHGDTLALAVCTHDTCSVYKHDTCTVYTHNKRGAARPSYPSSRSQK